MNSPAYKLTIEQPCKEPWSSMTPTETGRHCSSCDKIVIDFSVMSDEEVKTFFIKNHFQPVCGRFYNHQLGRVIISVPARVLAKPIPLWKKFLIVFLICFGSNLYPFDTVLDGKPGLYAQTSTVREKKPKVRLTKIKWKAKNIVLPVEPINDWITSGFTILMPVTPPIPEPPLLPIADSETDSTLQVASAIPAVNEKQEKKPPNKPDSGDKSAYILPTLLAYRRRKNKPADSG